MKDLICCERKEIPKKENSEGKNSANSKRKLHREKNPAGYGGRKHKVHILRDFIFRISFSEFHLRGVSEFHFLSGISISRISSSEFYVRDLISGSSFGIRDYFRNSRRNFAGILLSGGSRELIHVLNHLSVRPDPLQIIEAPILTVEDMDDDIAIVQQDPVSGAVPLFLL